ncbi:FecR family protein [Sphingobacterium bovistauri]|uniref:FecR domain-containing protein n=1 Tax=Sphingobacterium bovistauri TaxID=2781959 RepID=A0ABS7Z1E6_9SPHI|nr:FecR domain-containing protein [Sphingobacterium bovistauri]MCA5003996.1 FecR domain-containing protein [Sphingobacterium bovistauri]
MQNRSHIKDLIQSLKDNNLSEKDFGLLYAYFKDVSNKDIIEEELCESLFEEFDGMMQTDNESQHELDVVFNRIQNTKARNETTLQPLKRKDLGFSFLLKIAALLVAVLAISLIFYNVIKPSKETYVVESKDISPGSNIAYLSVDGEKDIVLDNSEDGIITKSNGISYLSGGMVTELGDVMTDTELHVKQLTLHVPKRGKYKVELPDGTKVWLNSDSKLKYPSHFSSKGRQVHLEGEAYFEVTKSAEAPFVVEANGQRIKVLGTRFNVQAYADDAEVVTSLLEGKVEVSSIAESTKIILSPGDQSEYNLQTGFMNKRSFDHKDGIGWVQGYFVLKGQKLDNVMRQISRWYAVDIQYNSTASMELKLGGVISHDNSLQKVLDAIEAIGPVKFKIQGNKVIVY